MRRQSLRILLSLPLFLSLPLLRAEHTGSLLPVFGGPGYMLNKQSKDNHTITGWLPKKWCDNSTWAAVNAVYSQLLDPPAANVTAIRIDIQAVDEGQLQLTSFEGNSEYKQGVKYSITGWVRSSGGSAIKAAVRADDESHAFYIEQDLKGTAEWKPFEIIYTPDQDRKGWVMFVMKQAGSVDLAGICVTEKQ
jgi:hypothetical protein